MPDDPKALRPLLDLLRQAYTRSQHRQGVECPLIRFRAIGLVRFEFDFDPNGPRDEQTEELLNAVDSKRASCSDRWHVSKLEPSGPCPSCGATHPALNGLHPAGSFADLDSDVVSKAELPPCERAACPRYRELNIEANRLQRELEETEAARALEADSHTSWMGRAQKAEHALEDLKQAGTAVVEGYEAWLRGDQYRPYGQVGRLQRLIQGIDEVIEEAEKLGTKSIDGE